MGGNPTQSETLLREALEPFAACCEQIADDESDEEWAKFRLLVKDYRRARDALQSIPSPLLDEGQPLISGDPDAVIKGLDEGLVKRHAELQHWFFQKLNPEQRAAFLFAAGVAPRTCDLTLGMQHQALRLVSAALSIPRLEAGRVTGSLTLDNASVQRLMDYGLLHYTDEGWVVSKDIWNASAPDGPALTWAPEARNG